MIEVIYHRQYNRVTVKGHAGSGPEGHDLVCASASALALTLAGNVHHIQAKGIVRNVITDLEDGNAEIQCTASSRYKATVEMIYSTICIGFELLATKYPENISYAVIG